MKLEWRTDTKPIDLSDEDATHFQAYCQWLYTKKIITKVIREDDHLYIAHLYVFGAKLMDRSFQENLLDALVDNVTATGKYPSNLVVKHIYEGTNTGDPARRLLVDYWAFKATPQSKEIKKDKDIVAATSIDFANDVIWALLRHRGTPSQTPPWTMNPVSYRFDNGRVPDWPDQSGDFGVWRKVRRERDGL
jgi:hypothetical protein